MSETKINQVLNKALLLETKERTLFLNELEEGQLKEKIKILLNDDIELAQFVLKTSHGAQPLKNHQIKDLKPGDKVNQFIIVKLIAKGGMGSVYLAYDEKLKRNVAIKTIRSEYIKEASTQQRFKQEAQILSQINHPSICQIYDYIDYEDGDMLVLELVDGVTLNDIDLSDQEKLEVFIQIASALEIAHKKEVIHRDLKPDNIMYTADKKIKVLDFGIAKSTVMEKPFVHLEESKISEDDKPITKMGTLMGTLLYMSPEQAQGKEITKASDIYSFGIIMQELLTGVTTYDLGSTKELKQQVINAENIHTELLSKPYKNLITAMTQRDSEKRPNAFEVINALKEIKEIPKRRLKKIALFSLILLAVLGFSKYTYDLKQQTNAAEQARIEAEIAQTKAEKSQQESEKVTEFLEGLFLVSDPFANAGEEMTARQMLDQGSKKINEELADKPNILFRLKATIGEIYTKLGEHELAQQQFDGISKMLASDLIEDEMKLEFLSKQASEYYETSQLDKMEDTLNQGMRIYHANKNLEAHYYYDLLFNLGVAYADKGEIDRAMQAYKESIAFYLKDKKKYQYKIIENYNSQGLLYANRGNNEKAIEYLEKALSMVNPQEDKDLDYKTTIKGNLSYIYSNVNQHEKAIAYALSIIELRKKLLGENHISLALSYDTTSTIFMAAGDPEKSIEYNGKALAIYRSLRTKNNKHYLVSMMNRATIYGRSGDDEKSENSYLEVLPMLRDFYGEKHKRIADLYLHLAATRINMKKYSQAEQNLKAAIKMYDELNYPIRGSVIRAYQSLAILYTRQGEDKKVLQTYKTLLENLQSEPEKDQKIIEEIQEKIKKLALKTG